MTGQYAEFMADEVENWTNIAAIKVGSTSKIQAIVNAVGTDGKLYHLESDSRWTELTAGVLDPAAGAAENSARSVSYTHLGQDEEKAEGQSLDMVKFSCHAKRPLKEARMYNAP